MKTMKAIVVACVGLAFLLVASAPSAQADCCYYFNPLFLPFAVAGAVLGTAAAITTGVLSPVYPYPAYYGPAYYGPAYHTPAPYYYRPGPYYHRSAWVRGHYNRYGDWIPGHWRRVVWIPGHYNRYGAWIFGHWG